jgi:hypothetical protein
LGDKIRVVSKKTLRKNNTCDFPADFYNRYGSAHLGGDKISAG